MVGLAFVVVPWVGREAPDRETPAHSPTPAPTVAGKPTRAADIYSVLKRPAQPNDAVDGLADARQLVTQGYAAAWLVQRQGAVCLVLKFHDEYVSGCRRNVADVRFPLVVAMPGQPDRNEPERVVAAVFPDTARNISMIPPVSSARSGNALIISQGETAKQLRWQISSRNPPRTETLPPGGDGFVLHAREQAPTSIPAETG